MEASTRYPIKENPLMIKMRRLSYTEVHVDELCYIGTNEVRLEDSKEVLETIEKVKNGCHIGVSGWHNFDIMTKRQSKYGLIIDINCTQKLFIKRTLKILRKSDSPKDFCNRIIKYYGEELNDPIKSTIFNINISTFLFGRDEIKAELTRDGSWLASIHSFTYLKKMAMEDRVDVITGDFQNPETFRKIHALLKKNDIVIDTLYLSNIRQFIYDKKKEFKKSVLSLIQDQTLVIHCPESYITLSPCPEQSVHRGKQIKRNPSTLFMLGSGRSKTAPIQSTLKRFRWWGNRKPRRTQRKTKRQIV